MTNKPPISDIKVPLSTYDIFGYIIPGLTFLVSVFSYEFYVINKINITDIPTTFHKPIHTLIYLTYSDKFSTNWVLSLFYLSVVICMIYVVGHIVSSASSLFIDRMLIYKGYGYPYEFLLNLDQNKNKYSLSFYKGLFFWVNITLILFFKRFLTNLNQSLFYYLSIYVLCFLIGTIVLKIFISSICHYRNSKLYKFFQTPFLRIITWPFKSIILHIFPLIYKVISVMLSKYLNTSHAFNEDFVKKYKKYFKTNFSLDPNISESNNYWLSYCYVADRSTCFKSMIVNWLHMYSYARNISMAFYLAFIYSYFSIILQLRNVNDVDMNTIKLIPMIYLVLSLIMLVRYYYLYVSYYTKFIFRSFVYLNESARKTKESEDSKKTRIKIEGL